MTVAVYISNKYRVSVEYDMNKARIISDLLNVEKGLFFNLLIEQTQNLTKGIKKTMKPGK